MEAAVECYVLMELVWQVDLKDVGPSVCWSVYNTTKIHTPPSLITAEE